MRALNTRTVSSLTGKGGSIKLTQVVFRNFEEEAGYLRKMVNLYSTDLALKEKALQIVRDAGVAARDEYGQALAIGTWVQENIYYVHEARETFQNPAITLRMAAGDCDKQAVLICSMLGTLGIKEKLCILKINGRWAHIFAVALVVQNGELHRLTLDSTLDAEKYPISSLTNPIAIVRARGQRCEPLFV
jgi:hypothetical protein